MLRDIDAGRVLDAATGRGEFIQTIKQKFRSYTQIIGVDSSPKNIDYTQKLFPENDIEIFRMDIEEMHFDDGYFDTVTISNSLHHLKNLDKVMNELMRVLKPGGMFLLTEMYKDGKQSLAQKTHIAMHHWIAKLDMRSGIFHRHTFDKDELIGIMNALPLENIQINDFYYPCDNPKDARSCDPMLKNCQDILSRLESKADEIFEPNIENAELSREGRQIVEQIKEVGCASSCRLLMTGYKRKL